MNPLFIVLLNYNMSVFIGITHSSLHLQSIQKEKARNCQCENATS